MAVIIQTADPNALLAAIKKAIDDGKIQTWSYDTADDFTHSAKQWNKLAWLRPKIVSGDLKFGMVGSTKVKTTTVLYAVYHGRFIESMLNHFDNEMSAIRATPLPVIGVDNI